MHVNAFPRVGLPSRRPSLASLRIAGLAIGFAYALLVPKCVNAQDLYIADGNSTVSKVSPAGTVTEVTATGRYATGLAFDSVGNLFIGSLYGYGDNNSIVELTPSDTLSTFVANLPNITSLAFDANGTLFVSGNSGNPHIDEITPSGVVSSFASLPQYAVGEAFDATGNLYVSELNTESTTGTVQEISPSGVVSDFATLSGLGADGLAFDKATGDLYAASGNQIDEITSDGTVSVFATGSTTATGLAFGADGSLYASGFTGSTTIDKITSDGTVSTFATGFNAPQSLAFGPSAAAVPEASSCLSFGGLLLLGLGGLAVRMRRRRSVSHKVA